MSDARSVVSIEVSLPIPAEQLATLLTWVSEVNAQCTAETALGRFVVRVYAAQLVQWIRDNDDALAAAE